MGLINIQAAGYNGARTLLIYPLHRRSTKKLKNQKPKPLIFS